MNAPNIYKPEVSDHLVLELCLAYKIFFYDDYSNYLANIQIVSHDILELVGLSGLVFYVKIG